jgi:hypothetical protein
MKLDRASSSKATATKCTMLLGTLAAMLHASRCGLRVQEIVNTFNDSTSCLIEAPRATRLAVSLLYACLDRCASTTAWGGGHVAVII